MGILLSAITLVGLALPDAAQSRVGEIAAADFERLQALTRPHPGESPWREIPWHTDIRAAREMAVATNRPLIVFTAADGSPLGRT